MNLIHIALVLALAVAAGIATVEDRPRATWMGMVVAGLAIVAYRVFK